MEFQKQRQQRSRHSPRRALKSKGMSSAPPLRLQGPLAHPTPSDLAIGRPSFVLSGVSSAVARAAGVPRGMGSFLGERSDLSSACPEPALYLKSALSINSVRI